MAECHYQIILPLPPSVNNAYLNLPGKGRVVSKALADWKMQVGWLLHLGKPKPVVGPFGVRIRVPEKMRGDVDNRIKPVVDALVKAKVTPDDRYAKFVSIERDASVKEGDCVVMVENAGAPT